MNAALLLVTTAWFAGADAAPAKPEKINPPATTAPAQAAPVASACGGDCGGCDACNSCCEEESTGHKLLGKLKGMFKRSKHGGCDTCEAAPACCAPAPAPTCCAPAPAPSCGGCDTCNTCDSCESRGHKFFSKFKGKFHRKSCDTCETCGGCDSCASGSYTGGPVPAGTPLPKVENKSRTDAPPQKMPNGVEQPLKPISLETAVPVQGQNSPF